MSAANGEGSEGVRAAKPPPLNVSSPPPAKATSAGSAEPPRTPHTPGERLAAKASASLNSFTSSKRFLKFCEDAFKTCDVDGSGSIDSGELFAAILLLNHHLNSLPLGKKQLPPSREKVQHLLQAHSHGRAELSLADFVAVCQDICAELATGVPRNLFIVFVLCPFLASSSKSFLLRTFGHLHAHVALAVTNVPDALFVPVATSLITIGVPLLIHKHDEWAHHRAVAASRKGRVGSSRREQMMGLIIALILPLFFAMAWPFMEPTLEALLGDQARAARAKMAPHLAPFAARAGRALDSVAEAAAPLTRELSALATSVFGPAPWRS